jgi:hypothetical protein
MVNAIQRSAEGTSVRPTLLLSCLWLCLAGPALAQFSAPAPGEKSPAPTYAAPPAYPSSNYPSSHGVRAPARPPAAVAPPVPPSVPPGTVGGNDPGARQLEATLPLDPATRNLQNQLPPDPQEVERELGLRVPVGPVRDLRGHVPSIQEIVSGLNGH